MTISNLVKLNYQFYGNSLMMKKLCFQSLRMKEKTATANVETNKGHALFVEDQGCVARLVTITLVMGAMENLVVRMDTNVFDSQVGFDFSKIY